MNVTSARRRQTNVPKRRQKHYSFNETLDEPANLIADEQTDVEEEHPAEENEPVEEIDEDDSARPAAFEE